MKKVIIASLLSLASVTSFADVKIISPEELQVVAIDEQDIKHGLLKAVSHEYKVDAGQHHIYVRYAEFFDAQSGEEHQIIKSDVGLFTTPVLNDGETYRLALAQKPKTLYEAQKIAEKPTIILYNSQNQIVAQHTFEKATKSLFGAGGALTRTYDLTKAKVKLSLPASSKTDSHATPSKKTTLASRVISEDSQRNGLIKQWEKASDAEKQVFLLWLQNQE